MLSVEGLHERVCQALRDAIVNGTLRPGERLVEDRIAEQMGISRAPIREAFPVLEREGLVKSLPKRGVIVSVLSKDDVHEIYALRSALECQAGRDACKRISAEDLEELGALVRRMGQLGVANDAESLASADVAFHRRVVELSRNGRLVEAWMAIMAQVRLLRRHVMASRDLHVAGITPQHEAILEALRSGDPDRAERCLRDHIESVSHEVFDSFPEASDEASGAHR